MWILGLKGLRNVKTGKDRKKRATCLARLQQNEINSDVARFPPTNQTCLVTNQVVAGCRKLK